MVKSFWKMGVVFVCAFSMSACDIQQLEFAGFEKPTEWSSHQNAVLNVTQASALKSWWEDFNDPVLNSLITVALDNAPDNKIAYARVLEARGAKRSTRGGLLPLIGASGSSGRQDQGFTGAQDFFNARVDASWEINLFGGIGASLKASEASVAAAEASMDNVRLTLAGDVARFYTLYRVYQTQTEIAEKNLAAQVKTLELISKLREFGEAPQVDVERAEGLVNTTRSQIEEFERLAENARLSLVVLTGILPEELAQAMSVIAPIPMGDAQAVLMSPTQTLALRPDVRAAGYNLKLRSALSDVAISNIYPSFSLSAFYGKSDGGFANNATIWNAAVNAAVTLIDFGRLRGQVDQAQAREVQAFETYRKTVLAAVADVETALNDYLQHAEKVIDLKSAYQNAVEEYQFADSLFEEGEVSFIEVLDAQRNLNIADSAVITAQGDRSLALIRLYKSLGVY